MKKIDAVRFGALTLQNRPWDELVASWRTLDALGLDSIWVADHLANPLRPERPWLDGWTCLPALAAATEHARIGALVSSMTLRNPAVLAKAAVTLDHASAGRAELAVGAGGAPFDHELTGVERWSPQERAERFETFVARVRALLDDERLLPKPLQDRIPLTVGGHGEKALALAARHADRWNTYGGRGLQPDEALRLARERNDRLTRLCESEGRDPGSLVRSILLGHLFVAETPWRSEEVFLDVVQRWANAGFDELVVYYPPEVGMPEGSVTPGVFERAAQLIREG